MDSTASLGARTSCMHKTSGRVLSIQSPIPLRHAARKPFKLDVEISVAICNILKPNGYFFPENHFLGSRAVIT